MKGRTRQRLGDTTGLILHVLVPEAPLQDQAGGTRLLKPPGDCVPRLTLIRVDTACKKGGFLEGVNETFGWEVVAGEHPWTGLHGVWVPQATVIDPEHVRPSGFHVLPWRWMVERPFARLSSWRRLATDDERLPSREEAWICRAMIRRMLRC